MLDHKGYFRGTTILSSGTAGTGKTSMAASFVAAACHRGERALYFSFEESAEQLARNMRSIGVDLVKPQTHHLLRIIAGRPTVHGLEMHLVKMHRVVNDFAPNVVVIDPLTSLMNIGGKMQTQQMLTRLIDFLKTRGVTTMFTSLSGPFEPLNAEESVSSLVDTWLAIDAVIGPTGRRPRLRIIKSRGMPHSTLAREVCFSKRGVELLDAA
jgi:circadian clock protein KaiC